MSAHSELYDVMAQKCDCGGNKLQGTCYTTKNFCQGNSPREFPGHPCDVLQTLPQTSNSSF